MKLPDRRLKKGHVITAEDVKQFKLQDLQSLTVAQLEASDIEENEAATRIAEVLKSNDITAAEAFTGRVNLYAAKTGILGIDKQLIDRINRVDPSITVATLGDDVFVEAGRMIATVKIIPFAVEDQLIEQVVSLIGERTPLSLAVARPLRVGLIATQLPSLKQSVMDKTRRIQEERLRPSASSVVVERRIDHTQEAVAAAIDDMKEDCDLLLVFGASAITDMGDVIPAGIEMSGGEVVYFGMPVDPGNLLLIGQIDQKPVIGAPGCARSPAENGFDWVLQRLICDLPVDEDYISGLGVGGLLMEIFARPQPREG
ncbi:MAG: molybdopterin-binding protein [Rhizobiaceae bacterium]